MPSIAGVGPVVLRWPAETVQPEVEGWRTYEAIRAACVLEDGGTHVHVNIDAWPGMPKVGLGDAGNEALQACKRAADDQIWRMAAISSLDVFARNVAFLLKPQPITLSTATKHLGALPRDWVAARDRCSERERYGLVRGTGTEDVGSWATPEPRCHRATLGTLAARYTPRRPDGSYNRHDARRWMRTFREVVARASDALLEGDRVEDARSVAEIEAGAPERLTGRGSARLRAVEVLCEVVGLEDAIGLTERPGERRMQTLSVTGTLSSAFAGPRAGAATITVQSESGTPTGTVTLADWEPVEMRSRAATVEPSDPRDLMRRLSGIDYGITLDSPLGVPVTGEHRRIEPGSRGLPHGVNLTGMASGQPTRFEFTHPEQAVDLERRADGGHVVGMVRAGTDTVVRRSPSLASIMSNVAAATAFAATPAGRTVIRAAEEVERSENRARLADARAFAATLTGHSATAFVDDVDENDRAFGPVDHDQA